MLAKHSGAIHNSSVKGQKKWPPVVTDVPTSRLQSDRGSELLHGVCDAGLHAGGLPVGAVPPWTAPRRRAGSGQRAPGLRAEAPAPPHPAHPTAPAQGTAVPTPRGGLKPRFPVHGLGNHSRNGSSRRHLNP